MTDDDDSVEFVSLNPAGPSSPRRRPKSRRHRPPAPYKRKKPSIALQDIIEISDDEGDVQSAAKGKGKGRAVEIWRDEVKPLDVPRKLPLFLPDNDSDSDEDVRAMLDVGDPPAPAAGLTYMQPSPKDKGKRSLRATLVGRFSPQVNHSSESPAPIPPSTNISLASVMPQDSTARVAAQILEILPDVERGHLRRLILHHTRLYHIDEEGLEDDRIDNERIMQTVLHVLFEDPNYPKAPAPVQPPGGSKLSAGPPRAPPRDNSPHRSDAHVVPLDRTMNRSTQSEQDVFKLLEPEPGPSDHSGDPVAPLAAPAASFSEHDAVPLPPPEPEQDPASRTLAQVLEIIPDVEPEHATKLIKQQLNIHPMNEDGQPSPINLYDRALQGVLHILFENPDYPKASKKRKRAADDEGEDSGPTKTRAVAEVDYSSKQRAKTGGKYYDELSLAQLSNDFPDIPYAQLFDQFHEQGRLYAPTFLYLRTEQRRAGRSGGIPSEIAPRHRKRKGKGKAAQRSDPEFERERAWLIRKLLDDAANGVDGAEDEEEEGFECGCCFSSNPFSKMTQCPDAHLFCVECVVHYASTLLGEHNPAIACMDQSGCKLLFSPSELRRILSPKLLTLYERVSQRKELEAAGLENLEECPFCEYQVVIENEHEKLFSCEREDCGAVSCRKCKKLDHLPKSCDEAAEDKKLDARHAIEEAMTAALMRNCPKCNKAFIKEAGCNKMVCPNCRTMSCYVCRKIIHGYEHFNQAPPYNTPKDPKKCQLWDSVDQRHADEVAAAAKRAQEEVRRANPEVADADLKVDLPPAPKPVVCNNPNHHHHHHHHHNPPPPHNIGHLGLGLPLPIAPLPPGLPAIHRQLENLQRIMAPQPFARMGEQVPLPQRLPPPPQQLQGIPYPPMPFGMNHPPPPIPLQHPYQTRARGPVPGPDVGAAARVPMRDAARMHDAGRARPARAVKLARQQ